MDAAVGPPVARGAVEHAEDRLLHGAVGCRFQCRRIDQIVGELDVLAARRDELRPQQRKQRQRPQHDEQGEAALTVVTMCHGRSSRGAATMSGQWRGSPGGNCRRTRTSAGRSADCQLLTQSPPGRQNANSIRETPRSNSVSVGAARLRPQPARVQGRPPAQHQPVVGIDPERRPHLVAGRRAGCVRKCSDAIQPIAGRDEPRGIQIVTRVDTLDHMAQGIVERAEIVLAAGAAHFGRPCGQAETHTLRQPDKQKAEYCQCDDDLDQGEAVRVPIGRRRHHRSPWPI